MAASTFDAEMTSDRLYPPRPILAVSLAVFKNGKALIARRARAPLKGLYSLPGGVVEIGETLREAALRELAEEVGLRAEILAFNQHVESIQRDETGIATHYVIASFVGRWLDGEARPRLEEADSVLWVDPRAPLEEPATPGLADILASAAGLAQAFA
jgi:ADP-ribose pyrophosphatase YjhB (NUDIX family)